MVREDARQHRQRQPQAPAWARAENVQMLVVVMLVSYQHRLAAGVIAHLLLSAANSMALAAAMAVHACPLTPHPLNAMRYL